MCLQHIDYYLYTRTLWVAYQAEETRARTNQKLLLFTQSIAILRNLWPHAPTFLKLVSQSTVIKYTGKYEAKCNHVIVCTDLIEPLAFIFPSVVTFRVFQEHKSAVSCTITVFSTFHTTLALFYSVILAFASDRTIFRATPLACYYIQFVN